MRWSHTIIFTNLFDHDSGDALFPSKSSLSAHCDAFCKQVVPIFTWSSLPSLNVYNIFFLLKEYQKMPIVSWSDLRKLRNLKFPTKIADWNATEYSYFCSKQMLSVVANLLRVSSELLHTVIFGLMILTPLCNLLI